MIGRLECFNCGEKTTKKKSYTVELNTADGKHKIPLCDKCGTSFNVIAKELEEIIGERPESI
jgi:NAD-dependent SIR2 family protein deacetylase